MRGVNISVPTDSLSEAFATVRKWLDQNDCHPDKFMQKRDGKSVRLFFDFNDNEEGKRFKEAFYGNRICQGDNPLLRQELEWDYRFLWTERKNRDLYQSHDTSLLVPFYGRTSSNGIRWV